MEEDEAFGWTARAGLVALGLALAGAGLLIGFFTVAVVIGALSDQPVQPWQMYALGLTMVAFPALILASGFRCLGARYPGDLKLAAWLAGAAALDLLLAAVLIRLPTDRCVSNPPVVRGSIESTGCLDRSWKPRP